MTLRRTLGLVLCVFAGAWPGASGATDALFVDAPREGEVARAPYPLVELSGWLSDRDWTNTDVVVALDVSSSTHLPVGYDVDGDGVVGAPKRSIRRRSGSLRPPRAWTTDPGDTIGQASREIARKLIAAMGRRGARVGLVSFTDRARTRAVVGPAEDALYALSQLRVPWRSGGTSLQAALRTGARRLRNGDPARERMLVVFSDGHPNVPAPVVHARLAAERAARRATKAGIEVHAVALGNDSDAPPTAFRLLSQRVGGRFTHIRASGDRPDAALGLAAPAPLADVRIRNLTADRGARAVRWFGDGSFDGYVPVQPGLNRVRVRARSADGREFEAVREFEFERSNQGTGAYQERVLARTAEVELAVIRKRRMRELEIDIEEGE